ncbi:MAG: hypothetical protein C0176_02130 [Mesoaciditoga sp.]|uniref:DUF1844 domain-containing protein n=1 Tax=Athalassotoga sp. TaxID=2022597 RepID=UPI000CB8C8C1|nr:MAG: hypothetical protein C0185_02720 [Mesoaciditoga sp.]PMP80465.1 MAG: hypothetical protein C0176_02130 [Mesoaciditoga sp.]HEU24723.1 DUF1844 domain-containing protein [Mesoaciditoga lauensis]
MAEEEKQKNYLSPEEIVSFVFGILEEKAWISLGLIKDTDGEFHKSKEDARFLIDLLDKMSEVIDKRLDENEVKEIKNHIANLQLNFVNQFK